MGPALSVRSSFPFQRDLPAIGPAKTSPTDSTDEPRPSTRHVIPPGNDKRWVSVNLAPGLSSFLNSPQPKLSRGRSICLRVSAFSEIAYGGIPVARHDSPGLGFPGSTASASSVVPMVRCSISAEARERSHLSPTVALSVGRHEILLARNWHTR